MDMELSNVCLGRFQQQFIRFVVFCYFMPVTFTDSVISSLFL